MPGPAVTPSQVEGLKAVLFKVGGGQFTLEQIREEATLEGELGLDSMRFVTLVLEIEEYLGRRVFSIDNLPGIRTVGDLFKAVSQQRSQT